MASKILVSTAYLPPIEYFSHILQADEAEIEKEENYVKQSYRNRCYILSAHGPQTLTVPVYLGSFHKTAIKEIRIDYSKRWQQVHLRAFKASYNASPYFEFYAEIFDKIILQNHVFLLDLNTELTMAVLTLLKISKPLSYTTDFKAIGSIENDYRYTITPKIASQFQGKVYIQVFNQGADYTPRLTILDLLFNAGPDSVNYL